MINLGDMITALTADYLNVYVIEPATNRGTVVKLEGYVIDGILDVAEDFCYSDILGVYADNRVYNEDREAFKKALSPETLLAAFADGRERIEVNYRVPLDGRLQHFGGLYTRISKQGETLKLVAGFRNTESIISLQEKTRKEGLYSAYAAISDIYLSMHRVNVQSNTYYDIKTTDDIRRYTVPGSNRFDENVRSIIKGLAKEESYASAMDFLDIRTIEKRMQGKNHIVIPFTGKVAGSCKFHLIREENDADGRLLHVILAVEVVEEGTYQSVFDGLSRNFRYVYLVNLEDKTARILKFDDEYGRGRIDALWDRIFYYEEFLNAWIEDQVHPDDREELRRELSADHLREVFAVQEEYTGTYRMQVNGRTINYQFNLSRLNKNGRIVAGFQNIEDIIQEHLEQERREREKEEAYQRELQEQKRQLSLALEASRQASKAKSTFLSSMSHDIRTPMNAILGFTTLAQMHLDDREKVQDYLGKISTSGTHLLSLINEVLDMSRIESGSVTLDEKPMRISDLLQDLLTIVQELANAKSQELCIDTQDVQHENVITDQLRLSQVLINIVGNAIKYTPAGGRVEVCLREKPCRMPQYASYEFTVRDNGIGMSKEFTKHIFDTFSRERSSTVSGIQGTGLGMAITKNIVTDMMGGTIDVESEEGKGSTFTVNVNLRLADEGAQEKGRTGDYSLHSMNRQGTKKARQYDYSGRRALLVEDNALNREIAIAILEETGMRIDSVSDGDEAVQTIKEAPADRYDLVLMDIQMPRMDGYTATRQIRALPDPQKADIPIVAMTANAFEEDREKSLAAGMNGHIVKPIRMEEMAAVFDAIL